MEKELENREIEEKRKQPSRPTKPSQAACPRCLTGGPRLSAAVLPRAHPPSLARCLVGPICRRQFPSPPALSLSLSLSRRPGSQVAEPLPRAPLSSLSAPWACPVSSAPSALAVDRCVRTRARRRISRPRRLPTCPAPFLEPRQCPTHTPRLISLSFTLLALCPRRQPLTETRARVPGHLARRRPLQASPSSALR
jgi:hypothetical protein